MTTKPSFILLFLMISFGSVTAVLFTPALPEIQGYFHISEGQAQLSVTLFLVGYALGQLLYGPLANRFGRKIALYCGITLEIVASLFCAIAKPTDAFWLLVLARFIMALGASVGLKMSFTLVADTYSAEASKKVIAHLMTAFAITPAIGVAIGGFLTQQLNWAATFYFTSLYGVLLLFLVTKMTETAKVIDYQALKFSVIFNKYRATLECGELPLAALLMGCGTSFVYVFASLSPFIAMQTMGLDPTQYGLWNLLPTVGIIAGSQLSAYFSHKLSAIKAIFLRITFILIGIIIMIGAFLNGIIQPISLFMPLVVIYIGLGFVYSNASSIATANISDKSNASAMMSFINMGVTTFSVLILGCIHSAAHFVLPIFYGILLIFSLVFVWRLMVKLKQKNYTQ